MPIGKNAIKRVANNGYSSVKSTAPDMENSVINEEKAEAPKSEAAEKKTAPANKTSPKAGSAKEKAASKAEAPKAAASKAEAPKKAPAKKAAPKKSMEKEPTLSPVNTAKTVAFKKEEKGARTGDGYINLGGELPYYLL
jgi:hypothetical protein